MVIYEADNYETLFDIQVENSLETPSGPISFYMDFQN